MNRQNESFVFYGSFYDAIDCIKDKKTRLEFYEFTVRYALENEEPDIQGANADLKNAIWVQIKFAIDSAQERRKSSVDSGKKGGRPSSKKQSPSSQADEAEYTAESSVQDESLASREDAAANDAFDTTERDVRKHAETTPLSNETTNAEGFSARNPRFDGENLNININSNINGDINANANANKEKPCEQNGSVGKRGAFGTGTDFHFKEKVKGWFSERKLGEIAPKTAAQISDRLESLGFSTDYLDYCLRCVLARYKPPAVNSGLVVSAITSWQEIAESYKERLNEQEPKGTEPAEAKDCPHCHSEMEYYPGEVPEWYCRKCRIHFKRSGNAWTEER